MLQTYKHLEAASLLDYVCHISDLSEYFLTELEFFKMGFRKETSQVVNNSGTTGHQSNYNRYK